MPADRRQLTAFALLGLVMVLWAGNSIVGRAVRFEVPPLTLAFVRWLGASLILLPFAIAR
jgi:drug/metabolite transporter (DMT)-like permease